MLIHVPSCPGSAAAERNGISSDALTPTLSAGGVCAPAVPTA